MTGRQPGNHPQYPYYPKQNSNPNPFPNRWPPPPQLTREQHLENQRRSEERRRRYQESLPAPHERHRPQRHHEEQRRYNHEIQQQNQLKKQQEKEERQRKHQEKQHQEQLAKQERKHQKELKQQQQKEERERKQQERQEQQKLEKQERQRQNQLKQQQEKEERQRKQQLERQEKQHQNQIKQQQEKEERQRKQQLEKQERQRQNQLKQQQKQQQELERQRQNQILQKQKQEQERLAREEARKPKPPPPPPYDKELDEHYYHVDQLLDRTGPLANSSFVTGAAPKDLMRKTCKILVIGAGGLGCEILQNLALLGFADIHVIDMDTIDISNLNRQFLFREQDIGQPKAEVAAKFITARVPKVKVTPHYCKIQDKDDAFYMMFNLVVCGLDSVEARRWINATLVNLVDPENPESLKPLIDGGTEGMFMRLSFRRG
ncbi:hypothetical protein PGTUg99_022189 [Puccinia graminis f. sp. tritici]|uniref:NEDD8-activating enzyme E1 catalytic subunit n=1 Tax=Puccinia graminis f. sp. tritici TaxID=56615 RepID=A0A5B0R7I7_PUCGR|nr:hypothetical protein PGTUg99_022189 [Puccinia graminis f. sp. tritici]